MPNENDEFETVSEDIKAVFDEGDDPTRDLSAKIRAKMEEIRNSVPAGTDEATVVRLIEESVNSLLPTWNREMLEEFEARNAATPETARLEDAGDLPGH